MDKMELSKSDNQLFGKIAGLLNEARKLIIKNVNQTIILTYFEIGKLIVEEEQEGKERAEYGKTILKKLSYELTKEFGKGYSVTNLQQMRKSYMTYQKQQTLSVNSDFEISQTVSAKFQIEKSASVMRNLESPFKLSWSHYIQLIKIENEEEQNFYEIEAVNNNWSVRKLERQYDSSLYERLVLSRDKEGIKELSRKGQVVTYVLPKQCRFISCINFISI